MIAMYYLKNDYSEICHPNILAAMAKNNLTPVSGYGLDPECEEATAILRQVFSCPEADIHYLVGGTQVNLTMIAHALRPYEAAVTVTGGHITIHESASVEATGHQVISYPAADGKVTPAMIEAAMETYPDEHTVNPALVYISDATEIGTIYTKAELTALHACCRENGLYLYLDGARLGTALTSPENDIQPADLARLTDAFYIGGTKNGAMFGEALVIVNPDLKHAFRNSMKQRGAMLAKGRLLGIQFAELFRENLWFDLATHANQLAARLQSGLIAKGIPLMVTSPTNQIFPILSNETVARLQKNVAFEIWGKYDADHTIIRFVTSWATREETVDAVLALL